MVAIDKAVMVRELTEKFSNSSALFISTYQGLKVAEVEDLRRKLSGVSAQFVVVKNTLARKALEQADRKDLTSLIEESSAITCAAADVIGACRVLASFGREHGTFALRGGFFQGQMVGKEEIKRIATLPSREVLLAQVAGNLNAPISGLVVALNALVSKLVRTLDAVAGRMKEKSSG